MAFGWDDLKGGTIAQLLPPRSGEGELPAEPGEGKTKSVADCIL